MDALTAYTDLVTTIRAGETFPPDHDYLADHAANVQAARDLARVDIAAENTALKARLAAKDAAFAAEQRMKAKGVDQADIDALKGKA